MLQTRDIINRGKLCEQNKMHIYVDVQNKGKKVWWWDLHAAWDAI